MSFNYIIPLQKNLNGELIGVASTLSIDRDNERMSEKALFDMVRDIKTLGVNLFGNHQHDWENTLGVIKDAELDNEKRVVVHISLDDASTNPKIPMLLNKIKKGIKLGLSVGGNVTTEKWEQGKNGRIKIIDGVKLYEISVVGVPSNMDSVLTIPQAIMKSAKTGNLHILNTLVVKSCPICFYKMKDNQCKVCFYKAMDEKSRQKVNSAVRIGLYLMLNRAKKPSDIIDELDNRFTLTPEEKSAVMSELETSSPAIWRSTEKGLTKQERYDNEKANNKIAFHQRFIEEENVQIDNYIKSNEEV